MWHGGEAAIQLLARWTMCGLPLQGVACNSNVEEIASYLHYATTLACAVYLSDRLPLSQISPACLKGVVILCCACWHLSTMPCACAPAKLCHVARRPQDEYNQWRVRTLLFLDFSVSAVFPISSHRQRRFNLVAKHLLQLPRQCRTKLRHRTTDCEV